VSRARGLGGLPYALIGVRRGCGCVRVAALVESRADRRRLERAWKRDGLVVVPTEVGNGRVSICRTHRGEPLIGALD
jgi:ribosomal protein L15E